MKPEKVKKICDFLRYRTNHVRQLMHNEGEGDDKSKIATFSTGSRSQWDGNATKAIEDQFLHFPKMHPAVFPRRPNTEPCSQEQGAS